MLGAHHVTGQLGMQKGDGSYWAGLSEDEEEGCGQH